jgi:hypothetical protein
MVVVELDTVGLRKLNSLSCKQAVIFPMSFFAHKSSGPTFHRREKEESNRKVTEYGESVEKSNQLRDDTSRDKSEVKLSAQTSAVTVGFKTEALATTKRTPVDLVIAVKEGAVSEHSIWEQWKLQLLLSWKTVNLFWEILWLSQSQRVVWSPRSILLQLVRISVTPVEKTHTETLTERGYSAES